MKGSVFIWIGIIAVVLGLSLAVWNDTPERPSPDGGTTFPDQENSLVVKDQAAGNVVTVEGAKLLKQGFVVISESNRGKPGKTLGASPILAAGENRLIYVTAKTEKGGEYVASLHEDNGDGKFDPDTDLILESKRGKDVVVEFEAQ